MARKARKQQRRKRQITRKSTKTRSVNRGIWSTQLTHFLTASGAPTRIRERVPKGTIYTDNLNALIYINTGTPTKRVWTLLQSDVPGSSGE